jgi:SAM-dependent methyltransferase
MARKRAPAGLRMRPDFGATAHDYRQHRAGFPDSFFERLACFGIGVAGQMVVDLGTGTGTLARGLARRGCRVTGIDPAAPLLEQAHALDAEAGVHVEYRVARAEDTGLAGGSADVVTAGQCWHWFDRPAAARESARILRPQGFIVIAHFDWIRLSDNVVSVTERLIEAHNPDWKMGGGLGIHPWWLRDLGEAGFRRIETFSYDVDVAYTPEAWRGRVRASAGVGATLAPEKVAAFDRELAAALAERFPGATTLMIPHRVFAVIARPPEHGAA